MTSFQVNDPSLESQWRAIILFGKNSATYKFAFGKSLLSLLSKDKTTITIEELAIPFSKYILEHLKAFDKQGNSSSSDFLKGCRKYINGEIKENELLEITVRKGFANVIDAFQNVNGSKIPNAFYEKNFSKGQKSLTVTDDMFKLKDSFHFQSFEHETEARWRLVETAWNFNLNPNLLEVQYDETKELFFLENNFMRRVNITSIRDSLNGYQKGKCFYSNKHISIKSGTDNLCAVDHFLPHLNKVYHKPANINGVWNLVLADKKVNLSKLARIPTVEQLNKLHIRNEYFIESNHPLAETIINQTGVNRKMRTQFLQYHYNIAKENCIHTWQPNFDFN